MPDWATAASGWTTAFGDGIIALACLVSLCSLPQGVPAARRVLADGILTGLGVLLAASILHLLVVQGWESLLELASLLLIRTLLKALFTWESARNGRGA